jgi:hypothetical protein
MDNNKQQKNKFDLKTNNESNNLIFVLILTGKETQGKGTKQNFQQVVFLPFAFACLFRQ